VHQVSDEVLNQLDARLYAKVVAEAAVSLKADIIIFSHNQTGKAVAPRVSARLKAGLVSGAVSLPDTSNGFIVKKNVFSGKAFANVNIRSDVKIISLNPNSFKVIKAEGTASVEQLTVAVDAPKVKVVSVNKVKAKCL
jgi:electron transfer flavoprotein alpha subunit